MHFYQFEKSFQKLNFSIITPIIILSEILKLCKNDKLDSKLNIKILMQTLQAEQLDKIFSY